VVAMIALEECREVLFLTFDYQQLNRKEMECTRAFVAQHSARDRHAIQRLDFGLLEASHRSLLLSGLHSPKERQYGFYVPGRNLIFLAHAAAYAEVMDVQRVYIGANHQDVAAYPDTGAQFIRLAEPAIRSGLKYTHNLEIAAPLLSMNKFQAIRYGHDRGLDYRTTWSCYLNGPQACGTCPACQARILNFHWAGLEDPVPYSRSYNEVLFETLAAQA
jgi:7-cyano-7-deazaguanine synthase